MKLISNVAGHQLVGFVGHADDRLQFVEHRVGLALFSRGRGVRSDAVPAIVGDARTHRQVRRCRATRERGSRHQQRNRSEADSESDALFGNLVNQMPPAFAEPLRLRGFFAMSTRHPVRIHGADLMPPRSLTGYLRWHDSVCFRLTGKSQRRE